MVTALGRLTLWDGIASRYAVLSSLCTAGIFGSGVLSLSEEPRAVATALGSTFVLIVVFFSGTQIETTVRQNANSILLGGIAATYEVQLQSRPLFRAPDPVLAMWTCDRDPYPSFHDRGPFAWIGRSISALPTRSVESKCVGDLKSFALADEGRQLFFATGWGFGRQDSPRIAWVALVDSAGNIAGLGRPDFPRRDVVSASFASQIRGTADAMLYSGFTGLVRAEIALWLVDREGRACSTGVKKPVL